MSKPFYADYVNHMVRAYLHLCAAGEPAEFPTPVDADNYAAVSQALGSLTEADRSRVTAVLGGQGPLPQRVEETARRSQMDPAALWTLVSRASGAIARHRRLL